MNLFITEGEMAGWTGGTWTAIPSHAISAVVHDSRKIVPGCLFVALRGVRFDAHDFVARVAQEGAAAAMVARERVHTLTGIDLPLLVVEDTGAALQKLAAGYRRKSGLTVVGVTGSTGKTTVKDMIACLLSSSMATACTQGNWNNEIGLPLSILAIPPGTRAGVLELGISHPGEMAPLCAIARPDWGVITNVGPVHLEFFASVEAIAREKGELLRSLPRDGTAVLSLDDPHSALLRAMAPGAVRTVSLRAGAEADYVLVQEDRRTGDCVVSDRFDGRRHTFRLTVPGRHNRHNALLALAVARGMGVTWDAIAAAFARYVSPAMRWEQKTAGGMTFINDAYNANPLSMSAAITTFREFETAGRKWLVLGDMLELGAGAVEEHRAIGRSLAGGPWEGLVTVGELGAEIARGAVDAGLAAGIARPCATVDEAVRVLKEKVVKGDVLLVKASRGKQLEKVIAGMIDGMEKG